MKLDRETKHKHQLIVNAKDHGTPSLSSNVTVDVIVTDTNDQNPVLVIDNKILEILENATIGSIVTRVYATDADLSENAKIGYRIVSGNDDGVFEINNKTGIVFTVKTMDHESLQQYQIGVQAYDFGSPSLQSDIQVITINIRDVNDNRPFFFQKSVTLSVFENKAPGSFVGGNGANIFAIGETSGTITTTKSLIFVLVDDQRVRLTLGINDTEYVRNNIDKIKRILDEATGLEFNIDNIQYHLQDNGRYDLSKTDIFMHAVDPKTNQVVDKRKALSQSKQTLKIKVLTQY
ncbi:protocadherin beta-1-like [Xenia sp. Carnegie-2017]|uniref:protocadherin beta-1-like n=1 Tax=Xenia sp. Carnegie-2017 TaxID=2897299 RepID=UPI001F040410|nr:protocadherin beta-1-like [Xenia sp. Carnegie-2017]